MQLTIDRPKSLRLHNWGYKKFELYYSHGGHGGPYGTVFSAVRSAIRLLCGSKSEIRIVVRDRAVYDPTLASVVVVEKTDNGILIRDCRY